MPTTLKADRAGTRSKPNDEINNLNLELSQEECSRMISCLQEAGQLHAKISPSSHEAFDAINPETFSQPVTTATHQRLKAAIDSGISQLQKLVDYLEGKGLEPDFNGTKYILSQLKSDQCTQAQELVSSLAAALGSFATELKSFRQKNPDTPYHKLMRAGSLPIIGQLSSKSRTTRKSRKGLDLKNQEMSRCKTQLKELRLPIEAWPNYHKLKSFEDLEGLMGRTQLEIAGIRSRLNRAVDLRWGLADHEHSLQNSEAAWALKLPDPDHVPGGPIDLDKTRSHYSSLLTRFSGCASHFHEFEDYATWRLFQHSCDPNSLAILSGLIKAGTQHGQWLAWFEGWYCQKLLIAHESRAESGFNTSDRPIEKLNELNEWLSKTQINKIQNLWDVKRDGLFRTPGINFNLTYNLRGPKGGRRNSLRKIVARDFRLFTSIFPVVLTNPSVANTLFPSKAGLFDFVIFDEASQLRIEDTFASLIMGRHKVISGDEHQMPPSNYFGVEHVKIGGDFSEDEFRPEDDSEQMATSESLLQYVEDLTAHQSNKSYLDYHYRSQHPDLIAFSNAAIYGNNLVPIPPKSNYNPIDLQKPGWCLSRFAAQQSQPAQYQRRRSP